MSDFDPIATIRGVNCVPIGLNVEGVIVIIVVVFT